MADSYADEDLMAELDWASRKWPNMASFVIKDQDMAVQYFGYSDLESKTAVTECTVFKWASVSKLVLV